jgi:ABC-2 type transport system ATP-binding protein
MTVATSALEVRGLTKQFGSVRAVDDVTFDVAPGRVTGFLGPNGAGKTTTLRMLLGLVSITAGTATFAGRRYCDLDEPVRRVGAVLEATSFHPGRRARDHLRTVAFAASIPVDRVDVVLDLVGLSDVGSRRVGKFSLGMRQRLQLATALLGDPDVLILDEPSNGLDPQGMQWLRRLIRDHALGGRAVLVSSHLLSEMEETVDDVVIVSGGKLVLQATLADLARGAGLTSGMRVTTRDVDGLTAALDTVPKSWRRISRDTVMIDGVTSEWFGPFAARNQLVLDEVVHDRGSLEDVFLGLTGGRDASDATSAGGGSE